MWRLQSRHCAAFMDWLNVEYNLYLTQVWLLPSLLIALTFRARDTAQLEHSPST